MPLSEHEQRQLDQIEQALYAEDPKFASSVQGKQLGKPSRARKLQGALLFLIGISLLPLGVMWKAAYVGGVPIIGIVGFLMMFFGVLLAVMSFRAEAEGGEQPDVGKGSGRKAAKRSKFSQRMEERFRRRFDEER